MDNSENDADADADDGNDNNKHSNDEDNYQSVADDMQPQKLSGNPYTYLNTDKTARKQ